MMKLKSLQKNTSPRSSLQVLLHIQEKLSLMYFTILQKKLEQYYL